MKVYLAGPMTKKPFYNVVAFLDAKMRWMQDGHSVQTPFDANSRVWRKLYDRDFDPYHDTCDYGDPILKDMFAEDVRTMLASDAIALLPGWQQSKGANLELSIARALGVKVYDAESMLPLHEESALEEAQRLVHGDRGAAYGHPIDDYTRTGRIWGAILGIDAIDPRVCCLMMAGVKISREVNAPKRDNRVDLAGYAECADMVAQRQAGA